ncbi:hypothetical protein J3E74DRAFT_330945 [Bipolaris maydis]|nr:hypothetical protein J3E74DRAFT_330945 [Bipolaris maydis]
MRYCMYSRRCFQEGRPFFCWFLDTFLSVTACCHAIRDTFVRFYVPRCTYTHAHILGNWGMGWIYAWLSVWSVPRVAIGGDGDGLGISDFETLIDSVSGLAHD